MRILRDRDPRNLEMTGTAQETKMDRRNFLKTIFLLAAGWTIFKWLRPFENAVSDGKTTRLKEARFYRRADHLAG